MPERRSQAARLREFGRLGRRLRVAQLEVDKIELAITVLALADQDLPDRATLVKIAAALGMKENTLRVTLKRARDRAGVSDPA